MRTTLNFDDDIFEAIEKYAASRSVSLGKAASELIRRGLAARQPLKKRNGLLIVDLPEDSPAVHPDVIRDLEAEDR